MMRRRKAVGVGVGVNVGEVMVSIVVRGARLRKVTGADNARVQGVRSLTMGLA